VPSWMHPIADRPHLSLHRRWRIAAVVDLDYRREALRSTGKTGLMNLGDQAQEGLKIPLDLRVHGVELISQAAPVDHPHGVDDVVADTRGRGPIGATLSAMIAMDLPLPPGQGTARRQCPFGTM
jgi:hypothetical protein